MKFEFYTAHRVLFGRGQIEQLGQLAHTLGRRAFVVRGGAHLDRSGIFARVGSDLSAQGVEFTPFRVGGEPDQALVEEACRVATEQGSDLVISVGGGAVLDTAKAVAGLLTNPGGLLDYIEVVGRGKPMEHPALPHIAVPTTAGTGAEVTKNAVITYRDEGVKASLRSPHMIPTVALVDPGLTDSMPPDVTASTGLDALTQLMEAYVSVKAQPLTDGLALHGVELAAGALRRAYLDGRDQEARDNMAAASLMGGICLANAGLGAVHGFAAPLGGRLGIPHGVACAALLPHVMAANVENLRRTEPDGQALRRYGRLARALLGEGLVAKDIHNSDAAIQRSIDWVRHLVTDLHIPGLARLGVTEADTQPLAQAALKASSTKGNPARLSLDDLKRILNDAM